jgi:hypothetical protein
MTIAIPEGFTLPEDTGEGSTIEALAELRLVDGMLELVSLDGVALPTEDEEIADEDVDLDMPLGEAVMM